MRVRKPRLTSKKLKELQGYKSGLELKVAEELKDKGIGFQYEKLTIPYVRECTYKPDFILENSIIIETKGEFPSSDRSKHLLVKKAFGDAYDIRFVFGGKSKFPSNTKIGKKSKTTYAMWCEKYGFKYADHAIPDEWLTEKV